MSRGGKIDRLLDQIPGYAGYRDKERRRESDRVIRDQLAREYGQLAERLGRLATALARERHLAAMPLVDQPHKRLVSFIDRVRTASYGYAPLFSDRPVGEDALDQIAAFDKALADQTQTLSEGINALESADPRSEQFKQQTRDLTSMIEALHDRFDKRGEVIQSGTALPHADVLALLETDRPSGPSVAYRLHEGEAVAYDGQNFTVVGRISIESPRESLRAFQLRGGSGDIWLQASGDPAAPLLWLRRVDVSGTPGEPTIAASGTTYTLRALLEGTGDVIGQQGAARNQSVRYCRYSTEDGRAVLAIFDWNSGHLALAGTEIDHHDVQLFSREK